MNLPTPPKDYNTTDQGQTRQIIGRAIDTKADEGLLNCRLTLINAANDTAAAAAGVALGAIYRNGSVLMVRVA